MAPKPKHLLGKVLSNTTGTWVRDLCHFVGVKLGDVLCNLVVPLQWGLPLTSGKRLTDPIHLAWGHPKENVLEKQNIVSPSIWLLVGTMVIQGR